MSRLSLWSQRLDATVSATWFLVYRLASRPGLDWHAQCSGQVTELLSFISQVEVTGDIRDKLLAGGVWLLRLLPR